MHLTQRTVRLVACRRCEGLKREACSSCLGQGFHTRSTAQRRYDGHMEYGAERVPCAPCYGVGYVPCTGCGGKGRVIR
jgi:DnaJ-class molecular chaperone